ncbi:hypothetical protein [Bradyrhizobium sp. LMTR 3]|uniref:hypothetical protein n=1 Tax=Bradyrhizobium sp. LMTR 3 TaxID=189873 RepID=UPI000810364F|nr:hypothetical protein [Bradyrhizobium sp. LMTR 3]OCK54020.1 hypothetical protein LMTR3_22855 [Bradyrhizobium sp. LMTR 3]
MQALDRAEDTSHFLLGAPDIHLSSYPLEKHLKEEDIYSSAIDSELKNAARRNYSGGKPDSVAKIILAVMGF